MDVRKPLTLMGLLIGAVALVGLTACAEKPTEHPFPKAKPKVTITGIQISGGVTRVFANGTDEDGEVQFYRFKFDSAPVIDSVTTSTYSKQIVYGSMDETHTVSVWCVDNDGQESEPATLSYSPNSVGAANRTPDTEILSPQPGSVTSEGVVVVWNARDPDGSVTGYQVRFDDEAWVDVSTTTYEKIGLAPGGHVVQVRAKDNFNVFDPTPATAAFTVKAGLKPELSTSGVKDGSTFFVAAGATVDIRVGWNAVADYYYGDIAGYSYSFNGGTATPYSSTTENTFGGLSAGSYTVDVYAKDIAGNVSKKTVKFTIVVPSLAKEVLAINGVDWSSYGSQQTPVFSEYFKADDPANNPWPYWDIFNVPMSTYPAEMQINRIGTGAPGGDVLGEYKCLLWLGNHYNGDLDAWNADLITGYIKAGGKLLLASRRTSFFITGELMSLSHITGFVPDGGPATGLKTTSAGAALGLQDITYQTPSFGSGITGTDGSQDVEVLFVDPADPAQINGIRAKSKVGGDWDIVVLTGRNYRADPAATHAQNLRLLLKNTLGVTPPAAP